MDASTQMFTPESDGSPQISNKNINSPAQVLHDDFSASPTRQQSPNQAGSSHTAESTASSNSLETVSSHPRPFPRSQGLPPVKPLHLTPSTWDQLSSTEAPPDAKFEFVDGLLVQLPMSEHVGNQSGANITAQMIGYDCPNVNCYVGVHAQVKRWWLSERGDDDDEDGPNGRCPDFCISGRLQQSPPRQSSSSSSNSREYRVRFSAKGEHLMMFTLKTPADAVFEYSSPSTRFTDLVVKWIEYALTKIRLYVIVESCRTSPDGIARVIVGSRTPMEGASRALVGDPLESTSHALSNPFVEDTSSSSSASQSSMKMTPLAKELEGKVYYKKIFQQNQVVECEYLRKFQLTAHQCQDAAHLNMVFENMKKTSLERNRKIESLSRSNTTLSRTNTTLRRANSEKDKKIAENVNKLAEKDKNIAEKDKKIAENVNKLAEKDKNIAEKDKKIAENVNKLAEKDKNIAEKDEMIIALRRTVAELERNSRGSESRPRADERYSVRAGSPASRERQESVPHRTTTSSSGNETRQTGKRKRSQPKLQGRK